jgi:hypothetical protein
MLIYTSDTNHYPPSQSFIDDLNKRHFWNCLCYLPNANITVGKNIAKVQMFLLFLFISKVLISKTIHVQFEITGIRLQTNDRLLTLFERLQRLIPSPRKSREDSKYLIEISLHIKLLTLVICDTVPGK